MTRYAVYYVPAADDPLGRVGGAWLGRNVHDGRELARPKVPDLADLDLSALTADPRVYGFHATLKAPFELADGVGEAELAAFAARFAAGRAPFEARLAPATLGRFLALRIEGSCPPMDALAADCVRAFDPFRAPLSDFDLARRRKAALTPAQDARLIEWGYPYIFEDFRFHVTLTGQIADEATRGRVLSALQRLFPAQVHRFDAIALFRQPARDRPFEVLSRYAFAGVALDA